MQKKLIFLDKCIRSGGLRIDGLSKYTVVSAITFFQVERSLLKFPSY